MIACTLLHSDEFRDPGSAVLLYTKLYVLADRFNVQELKAFNFGKLKELLRKRQVDQTNFTPTMIVAAARYAVANLTSANEDIVDYLLGYLAWIFPSICHLPELASLIREYPDIAIVLLKLTSHAKPASKLSTVNIHTWSQKNPDASPIHWTKRNQVQHPLPSLAFTLTGFDVSPSTNIQLWASYQWVENGLNPAYNAILDSGNNVIHSASCSWLEIPADHPLLRTGTYTMTEPLTRDNGPKLIPIQFSQPFTRNAKVLTFLNGMHFDMDPYWRVVIEAIDANKKGFTLKLSTWHNTIVLGLGVTWVAYPEGTPGITSGVADTCSLRRWSIPQPNNAWYQSFVGNAAFKTTPRILLGLSGCDAASDRNFRLATEVVTGPETNQHGFMWRANTWGDSIMYRTWLAYLAFDPNLLRELAIESKIVQLNESAIRD
ncbi:hypothetical protein BDZ91DRAFT_102730 [Kalaharituber pfeilii]|nr:hypothetical protein BDZ91DRAFT_102730 [Kalaharituber pfeilii]